MIDKDGYRPNVGIVLCNARNEVFWGKRVRQNAWQFPQGGIKPGESPEQAMYRELHEEVGLLPQHVRILGRTRNWLRYDVPREWVRRDWHGHYRGQKQIWYLLRLTGRDCDVCLRATDHPEFDAWRWSAYWEPVEAVVAFKRDVYRLALEVMTDFSKVTAYTIGPLETIESARARMIHHGVRMLLVVDEQNQILGLITATDLTSEKPMQVIQTQGIRHSDVLVKDIMTPRERLEVLCIDDLKTAVVGDVVATLQAQGRQHALVADRRPDRSQTLRGLFSASQISKLLGTPIHTLSVARTFAEIGAALNR